MRLLSRQRSTRPGQMSSTGAPPPTRVACRAGWNMVAVMKPTVPFFGLAYTLQAGDSGYAVIPLPAMLQPKVGYWVYFRYDAHIPSFFVTSCEIAIPVPGGGLRGLANPNIPVPAGQWIMIGNPLSQPITVMGADAVYTYDPTAGSCMATPTLQVGQGRSFARLTAEPSRSPR